MPKSFTVTGKLSAKGVKEAEKEIKHFEDYPVDKNGIVAANDLKENVRVRDQDTKIIAEEDQDDVMAPYFGTEKVVVKTANEHRWIFAFAAGSLAAFVVLRFM